jgi:hypothetical protein
VTSRRAIRIAAAGLVDSVAWLAAQGAGVRLPATEWLVARGRARPSEMAGWRDWLLAGTGLGADVLERFPAGPCASATGHGPPAAGTWARAEPVHLLTALDHLQLAAPVPLPLEATESAELVGTLNDYLEGTGFKLRATDDGGWLCACPAGLDCSAVEPSLAVGRNLREWLPTGRDASRIQALVNELQMLLHQHPVNERRAARGLPAVNSVWCWGVGVAGTPAAAVTGVLVTDDAWLAGLWRLHAGRVRPVGEFAEVLAEEPGDVRVACGSMRAHATAENLLRSVEEQVLAPARTALATRRAGRVLLHAGRQSFDVGPGARWAFWRRPRPLARVLA